MWSTIKSGIGRLPERWQQNCKRLHFSRQIRRGAFYSDEPEYKLLDELVSPGDWVIDVGANVGHFTLRLSQLVQSAGRVFAFEPVPNSFELLAANCALASSNITLLNVAASNQSAECVMEIPEWTPGGLSNYYEAHITNNGSGENSLKVMMLPLDTFDFAQRVSLIKVDAEGHELEVSQGMQKLLARDKPVLIVEGGKATSYLHDLGYDGAHTAGSPNMVFRPRAEA